MGYAHIDDKLATNLAKLGLSDPRQGGLLGDYIDAYTAQRRSNPWIEDSTVASSDATHKDLRSYFGENKPLRQITRGDASRWRDRVARSRAENTVRKWVANAKKLFNAAIDDELIEQNPFAKIPSHTIANRSRDHFLTPEHAELG